MQTGYVRKIKTKHCYSNHDYTCLKNCYSSPKKVRIVTVYHMMIAHGGSNTVKSVPSHAQFVNSKRNQMKKMLELGKISGLICQFWDGEQCHEYEELIAGRDDSFSLRTSLSS